MGTSLPKLGLRAFGGLALVEAEPIQPKRLALLGYLVLTSARGLHRRDSLVALFWPELDDAHARHSLRQALTALRGLDERLVVTRGDDEVGIAPGVVQCDVLAFEQALQRGEPVAALEQYSGPFLDGFFLADCPEFERWVEAERVRLGGLAAEAAWRLAEGERVPAAAVQWARRAASCQPDDEGALRRLMRVLDGAGDRAGALREYEGFARRLREQYQAEPASETEALAAAVRERREATGVGVTSGTSGRTFSIPPQPAHGLDSTHPAAASIRRRFAVAVAIMGSVALAAVGLHWIVNGHGSAPSASASGSLRLAVLPFENLGRPEDEFFADGMTEEITSRLAQLGSLEVVGRPSAMQYKGSEKPLRTIAIELHVQYVLRGSVRWSGHGDQNRVRIATQLIRVTDQTDVWAEQYDAALIDVFAVQQKVAGQVASALGAALVRRAGVAVTTPATRNPAAYEQYLRGNALYAHCGTRPCLVALDAARHYEDAVRLDPGFAAAWARLSLAITQAGHPVGAPPPRAWEAASQALTLQPGLPEAYVAQGRLYSDSRDLEQGEATFRQALELQPGNIEAQRFLASLEIELGRTLAARDILERRADLDPRDPVAQFEAGLVTLRLRHWDEAEKYLERFAALAPPRGVAPAWLALLRLMRSGDTAGARRLVADRPPTRFYNPLGFIQLIGFCGGHCAPEAHAVLALPRWPGVDSLDWHPYMSYGILARMAGDSALARTNLDSALVVTRAAIEAGGPDNLHVHHDRAAVLALLGRKEAALGEADSLVQFVDASPHGNEGPGALNTAAEIYAMFGKDARALELLDKVLSMPSFVTVPLVRVNPVWLRFGTDPRFQAVLTKHERHSRD